MVCPKRCRLPRRALPSEAAHDTAPKLISLRTAEPGCHGRQRQPLALAPSQRSQERLTAKCRALANAQPVHGLHLSCRPPARDLHPGPLWGGFLVGLAALLQSCAAGRRQHSSVQFSCALESPEPLRCKMVTFSQNQKKKFEVSFRSLTSL